ncbi:hypothetical protein Hypma_001205 [Hypsizygus marmoreus]|uniref:Uncharacterized protein n=1 Tax=Hypsizygus marmoreus TaxID=39966 RepID=A0A369J8K7_HYPMA|nr:hypothetical protein Hypma_001205 [Hypsizygus marmoreus]
MAAPLSAPSILPVGPSFTRLTTSQSMHAYRTKSESSSLTAGLGLRIGLTHPSLLASIYSPWLYLAHYNHDFILSNLFAS